MGLHSTFDVWRSMFDVHPFLDQPFFQIICLFLHLFLFNIRSAGGGQVLARLWRVGRSMFDVHFFQSLLVAEEVHKEIPILSSYAIPNYDVVIQNNNSG